MERDYRVCTSGTGRATLGFEHYNHAWRVSSKAVHWN
jgi:hypothetical protein